MVQLEILFLAISFEEVAFIMWLSHIIKEGGGQRIFSPVRGLVAH